jgi:hypothetical protein
MSNVGTIARKDLVFPQSGMYRLVVTIVGGPISIAGYTGAMQVRPAKASAEVLAEMDPAWFTVDDVNRQLVLEVPDEATAAYDWSGLAVYDLYLTNGTDRWRLVEGNARLDKTVTRES